MTTRRALVAVFVSGTLLLACGVTFALVPRDDQIGDVDAVIVLGGGGIERLTLGSAIATRNDVPLVLSAEGIAQGRARGLRCDVQVRCINPDPVTTAGEATTMYALAEDEGWDRIAVATSSFHVNRSRTLFAQCFGGRVQVTGATGEMTGPVVIHRGVREIVGQIAAMTVRRAC